MDLKNKLNDLKYRRYGDDISGEFLKSFSGSVDDELLYIFEAMQPVDKKYTANTYVQCERIQQHLTNTISSKHSGLTYEYQGSVPLNTHTRRHSDIDMLVATGRYHNLKSPLVPRIPYTGDDLNDMIELRRDIVSSISTGFPAVEIDDTGGKAVAISGGSLNRKMDLVAMAWVYNQTSYNTSTLTHRGIRLYDKKERKYVENFPFLHLSLCESKDLRVGGKFKKLVRYVKNVRKDSDQNISMSSYDATGLMYLAYDYELNSVDNNPAALSVCTENFLRRIIADENLQITATVPNETRLLFGEKGLKINEVIKLCNEISEINRGISQAYRLMDYTRKYSFEQSFQKAS